MTAADPEFVDRLVPSVGKIKYGPDAGCWFVQLRCCHRILIADSWDEAVATGVEHSRRRQQAASSLPILIAAALRQTGVPYVFGSPSAPTGEPGSEPPC
jgi:hypothetical protein